METLQKFDSLQPEVLNYISKIYIMQAYGVLPPKF